MIQRGEADIIFTGGYDSMLFNFGVYAFCLLGVMSTQNKNPQNAMKPFDKNRDGFALGEGAAIFILEEETHAQKRRARMDAEIKGYGASVDAYKVTDPHPEGYGAVLAMQRALHDAQMKPEQIEYINAHGTATPKNDRIETNAIKKVFSKHAYNIPVSSTKSMIGHLMSAGGALELAATILGMHNGFVPPTINYENFDPDCDLDYVPNKARDLKVETSLSNSFGLGGQNASIIVSK
jgi:3-oxoacyl-[acyl-carrier-protein] synthase II